jgi:5-methylcytosine-specific restriction protein A
MVSRKEETFFSSALELAQAYTRPQLTAVGRVAPLGSPREWGGFVEFSNELHIWVTLHKTRNEPQHMYNEGFEGEILHWESRAEHHAGSLQIKKLLTGDRPVRLFARIEDGDPFLHCGTLTHIAHAGERPVSFLWHLDDHERLRHQAEFQKLASWQWSLPPRPEVTAPVALKEGWATTIAVNKFEREPAARAACLAHYGYKCWVCSFDFRVAYGSLGEEFSFVHHRWPIARRAREGAYKIDPVHDLIPICGNCHAMVHRPGPTGNSHLGSLPMLAQDRLAILRAEVLSEDWNSP